MDLTGRNISDYLVKTYPSIIRTKYLIFASVQKVEILFEEFFFKLLWKQYLISAYDFFSAWKVNTGWMNKGKTFNFQAINSLEDSIFVQIMISDVHFDVYFMVVVMCSGAVVQFSL